MSGPEQLSLFPDLYRDDPLVVYYRRLRKAGCALHYDRVSDQLFVWRERGVPAWAIAAVGPMRDRIVADLLRFQYGAKPAVECEALDGGASLHRLPSLPEVEPPVRQIMIGAHVADRS